MKRILLSVFSLAVLSSPVLSLDGAACLKKTLSSKEVLSVVVLDSNVSMLTSIGFSQKACPAKINNFKLVFKNKCDRLLALKPKSRRLYSRDVGISVEQLCSIQSQWYNAGN